MKSLRKKIVIISMVLSIVIGASSVTRGYFIENENEIWGEKLKEDYDENVEQKNDGDYKVSLVGECSENTVDAKDVYAAGNDILVTDQEIQQAEDYYVLNGAARSKAKEKADEHVKEQNALYVEAVKNGFDVTSEEIKEYLKELKIMLNSAENQEEVKDIMDGFESEEEYWEYEYYVYQKLLPVQKYVKHLEEQFKQKQKSNMTTEEIENKWDLKFEKIKDKLVDKQNFDEINNASEIDKEFKME